MCCKIYCELLFIYFFPVCLFVCQVQFIGEEGEDAGGVAKEFFMLLSQCILSPDFGMFMEDEESHLSWFSDGVCHMTP